MNRKSNLWLDRRRLSSSKFYYNISWCISGWSWRRVQKSDRPPRRNQRWGIPWSWSCCEKRRTIFKACWRKRRWFWHTWEENCMGNGHSKVSLHTSWGLSSIPWYVSLLILQTLYVSLISMNNYYLFHIANTRGWRIFLLETKDSSCSSVTLFLDLISRHLLRDLVERRIFVELNEMVSSAKRLQQFCLILFDWWFHAFLYLIIRRFYAWGTVSWVIQFTWKEGFRSW